MPTAEDDGLDRRSLHERIAADLRDQILSGDLAPGVNLPSTTQLKARFDASSATIQKALHLLKEEQLVVGRPGAAVTVRAKRQRTFRPAEFMRPVEAGQSYSWLNSAAQEGLRADSRLVEVSEVRPPADVASGLRIGPEDKALLRSQVLSIEGEPVELVKCYYPLDIARGTPMMLQRKVKGGTPKLLADLGHPPRLTVDRVSARIPTQEEYGRLRLPTSLPVLRTLRVVYSDDDLVIEVTVMAKAGHLYELQYEFTAD